MPPIVFIVDKKRVWQACRWKIPAQPVLKLTKQTNSKKNKGKKKKKLSLTRPPHVPITIMAIQQT